MKKIIISLILIVLFIPVSVFGQESTEKDEYVPNFPIPEYFKIDTCLSQMKEEEGNETADLTTSLLMASLGAKGGTTAEEWCQFEVKEETHSPELVKEINSFYEKEYKDQKFKLAGEPELLPMNIMGEELGKAYQSVLSNGKENIWIVVWHVDDNQELLDAESGNKPNGSAIGYIFFSKL